MRPSQGGNNGASHLRYGMHSPPPKLVGLNQGTPMNLSNNSPQNQASGIHKIIIEQLLAALGKDVKQIAQIKNQALSQLANTDLLDYLVQHDVLNRDQSVLVWKAEQLRTSARQRRSLPVEEPSVTLPARPELPAEKELKHSPTAATLLSESSRDGKPVRPTSKHTLVNDPQAKTAGGKNFSDSFEGITHNNRFETILNQVRLSQVSLPTFQLTGKRTQPPQHKPNQEEAPIPTIQSLKPHLTPEAYHFISLCHNLTKEVLEVTKTQPSQPTKHNQQQQHKQSLISLEDLCRLLPSVTTGETQTLGWLVGLPQKVVTLSRDVKTAKTQVVGLTERVDALTQASVSQAVSMGTLRDELKSCSVSLSESKNKTLNLEKELSVALRRKEELEGEVVLMQAELDTYKQVQVKNEGSVERENKRLREEIEGLILESEEMVSALQEIEENMHLQKQQSMVADPTIEDSPRHEEPTSSLENKDQDLLKLTTDELNNLRLKYEELVIVAAEHEAVAKDLKCRLDNCGKGKREPRRGSAGKLILEGSSGSSQHDYTSSSKEAATLIKENYELIRILQRAARETQAFKEFLPADEEFDEVIQQTDFLDALKEIQASSEQRNLQELVDFNKGLWESVEHYRQLKQKMLNAMNSREGQTSSGRVVVGIETPNTPWSGESGRSPEPTLERSEGLGLPEVEEPTGGSASVEDELSPEQLVELLLQVLQLCEKIRKTAQDPENIGLPEAVARLKAITYLIDDFKLFGEGGSLGEFLGSEAQKDTNSPKTAGQAYYLPGERKPRQGKSHRDINSQTNAEISQLEETISLMKEQAEVSEITVRDLQLALTAALRKQGSTAKELEKELLRVIANNEKLASQLNQLKKNSDMKEAELAQEVDWLRKHSQKAS